MKLANIALAGVALTALATPAAAADGWYLRLGGGWSSLQDLNYRVAAPGVHITFEDAARPIVTAGTLIAGADGHVSVGTFMANVAYDFPIAPDFAFTVGAGLGGGRVLAAYKDPTETNRRGDTQFAWQLIAGVIWSITPQADLQLD